MAQHLLVTFNKMVQDADAQARGGKFRVTACGDTFRLIVGRDEHEEYLVLDGKGSRNLAADAAVLAHLRQFEGATRSSGGDASLDAGVGLVTAWHTTARSAPDGAAVYLSEAHATTLAARHIKCVRAVANAQGKEGLDALVSLADVLLMELEKDETSVQVKHGSFHVTHSHQKKLSADELDAIKAASQRGVAAVTA
jgi:hypothetical protein